MVRLSYDNKFLKIYSKIKDDEFKKRVKNQIKKIVDKPEIGKPMKYERKGTREVYVGSYRLAYAFIIEEDKLIFLDFYHKDEQ